MHNNEDLEILAKTIFGEARGEYKKINGGLASLIAIGNVILNRFKKEGNKTVKEICLKKYQFSCWNENEKNHPDNLNYFGDDLKIYKICEVVAHGIFNKDWPDLTNGSCHYYSESISKTPYWAINKRPVFQIGSHLFFNNII